jgi:hypothetical protein
MSWHPYLLDDCAQQVVNNAILRDATRKSLNQVFKMRMTTAYGLERFWGEYLRLSSGNAKDKLKADIIHDTWIMMKQRILVDTGIDLPYDPSLNLNDNSQVRSSLSKIWELSNQNPRQAQVVLAVLVNFCDAIIWWKNRLSPVSTTEVD